MLSKEEVFAKYGGIVIKIAKKFKGFGLRWKDLLSAGNLGLLLAIEKYNPSKKSAFSTCAYYWITYKITREIQNNGKTIRQPVWKFTKENNYLQGKNNRMLELDYKVGDKEDSTMADFIEDKSIPTPQAEYYREDFNNLFEQIKALTPENDWSKISNYFRFEGETNKQIYKKSDIATELRHLSKNTRIQQLLKDNKEIIVKFI